MAVMSAPAHADIHISYVCNRECPFCSEGARMDESGVDFVPAGIVVEKLRELKARGVVTILLTGGEVTLHPGLEEIVCAAAAMSLQVGISTNGMTGMPECFDRIAGRIKMLQVSYHGPDAETFDGAVGVEGARENLMTFLEGAKKYAGRMLFMANVVMTKRNHEQTLATVKDICSHEMFKLILLSNLAPEGRALDNYRELALPLARVAEIVDSVKYFLWKGNIELHVFGVPFCVLGRHGANSNDMFLSTKLTVELDPEEARAGRAVFMETLTVDNTRERVKTEKCASCSCNSDTFCGGVFRKYYEEFGDGELSPVQPDGAAAMCEV